MALGNDGRLSMKAVLRLLLGMSVAGLFAMPAACMRQRAGGVGEETGARTERSALAGTACTSDANCGSTESCCQGLCRPSIGKSTANKLAGGTSGTRLVYGCYANQPSASVPSPKEDNILPDFSYAGYMRGGVAIPNAPAFTGPKTLPAYTLPLMPRGSGLNDSEQIQHALDDARASVAGTGNSVAVVLGAGTFYLDTALYVRGGVVLRGQGQGIDGTTLVSRKNGAHSLVRIQPETQDNYPEEIAGTKATISTPFVPVGTREVTVGLTAACTLTPCFAAGQDVVLVRVANQAWIDDKGMGPIDPSDEKDKGWRPGDFTVSHPRRLTNAVDLGGGFSWRLTFDIPIVDPHAMVYGGGYVARIAAAVFAEGSGVENLRLDAMYFDTSAAEDENDWVGVYFSRARNSWARGVTVEKFGMSAAKLVNWSSFNTIEEVAHVDIRSPIDPGPTGAYRDFPEAKHRYSFYVGSGIGNLFQRCVSVGSRHSFVTGTRVTGPNVWLDCLSLDAFADDGPHLRWATGLLFDNIRSEPSLLALSREPELATLPAREWITGLHVQNRGGAPKAQGWAGAQVMFWNSEGTLIADAPPGAMNWVVGGIASKNDGNQVPSEAFGIWRAYSGQVSPRSLYLRQLEDRLGSSAVANVTTAAQRDGRIWDALRVWLGNGTLSAPAPGCDSNRQIGRTCCDPSCSQCGGSNCSSPPNSSANCCNGGIAASHRSCTRFPPPCEIPDPTCQTGQIDGTTCACASGGNCPTSSVAGRSCSEFPPPCILVDRCTSGVPGLIEGAQEQHPGAPEICCRASCNQCGSSGCGSSPNTSSNCCAGAIAASEISCEEAPAPCVLN